MFQLPRTVVVLAFVSMFNDAASDMIAPLLPLFLVTALGAGPTVVGFVEGVAEATASVVKYASGRLADRGVPQRSLVLAGYGGSNLARPLIGLALSWPFVLGLRFLDRVGKGIRSAPRDAMIAAATPSDRQGEAFGFHRALDNAGAVIGPLAAYALLAADFTLPEVFFASAVFGVVVMGLLVFAVPTQPVASAPAKAPPRLRWSLLDRSLAGVVAAAALLAASSVPEVLLVLWATERGLPMVQVPLLWAAASLVKVLVSAPAGRWSDRVGRLRVLILGWTLRVAMLLAFAFAADGTRLVWGVFLGYAGALAFTEGAERALIADRAPEGLRATAYGLYYMASGLLALPGALALGWLWEGHGAAVACSVSAAIAALAACVMALSGVRDRA